MANLRWSVRWRMLMMGVLVAYCLPILCMAALMVRLSFDAQARSSAPESDGATATTETPAPARKPTTQADTGWDYRQSVDLRAELCARLGAPLGAEAYATLCAIHTPVSENTSAPIVEYLRATLQPGETTRAEVDALLGAYAAAEGVYLAPVRAEGGREVHVRLVFTFDNAGVYQGFEDEGEE